MERYSERGNMLWFILLAIVLLGALTMLLSRSGSSVDQSGDIEQLRIKASQVLRYAKGIEEAVDQLRMNNGCGENQISFETAALVQNHANPATPSNGSCKIFDSNGSGLALQKFGTATLDGTTDGAVFTGNIKVTGIGTDGAAASNNELVAAFAVSKEVCDEINRTFGISGTTADLTGPVNDWDVPFAGTFTVDYILGGGANQAPAMANHRSGCFIDQAGGYIFYHVLIAR